MCVDVDTGAWGADAAGRVRRGGSRSFDARQESENGSTHRLYYNFELWVCLFGRARRRERQRQREWEVYLLSLVICYGYVKPWVRMIYPYPNPNLISQATPVPQRR